MGMATERGLILVVDDEPELREVIAEILRELNAEVITATNGLEALEILRARPVDAVLSDIDMPVLNGLELLRETKRLGIELPFVFVTAFGEKGNVLTALRLGAIDFIEKPFRNETVVDVMARALELGLALREVQIEVDGLFQQAPLPLEELVRLKNMRKAAVLMKMEAANSMRRKSALP